MLLLLLLLSTYSRSIYYFYLQPYHPGARGSRQQQHPQTLTTAARSFTQRDLTILWMIMTRITRVGSYIYDQWLWNKSTKDTTTSGRGHKKSPKSAELLSCCEAVPKMKLSIYLPQFIFFFVAAFPDVSTNVCGNELSKIPKILHQLRVGSFSKDARIRGHEIKFIKYCLLLTLLALSPLCTMYFGRLKHQDKGWDVFIWKEEKLVEKWILLKVYWRERHFN